jgi:hypothetical protein
MSRAMAVAASPLAVNSRAAQNSSSSTRLKVLRESPSRRPRRRDRQDQHHCSGAAHAADGVAVRRSSARSPPFAHQLETRCFEAEKRPSYEHGTDSIALQTRIRDYKGHRDARRRGQRRRSSQLRMSDFVHDQKARCVPAFRLGAQSASFPQLSYKAWQRRYGRSAKVRGVGMFVSILGNKLKAADGELIGTRYTCLSRFDHIDSTPVKKPPNQRFHQFSDGTRIGPDLCSAFLARFVHEDRLDASQAQWAWPTSQAMLRAASYNFEPARGRGLALPHVILGVGVGCSKKPDRKLHEAGDAVAQARAPQSGAIWSHPGGT